MHSRDSGYNTPEVHWKTVHDHIIKEQKWLELRENPKAKVKGKICKQGWRDGRRSGPRCDASHENEIPLLEGDQDRALLSIAWAAATKKGQKSLPLPEETSYWCERVRTFQRLDGEPHFH